MQKIIVLYLNNLHKKEIIKIYTYFKQKNFLDAVEIYNESALHWGLPCSHKAFCLFLNQKCDFLVSYDCVKTNTKKAIYDW